MSDHVNDGNAIWANVSITKQIERYEPIKIEAGARKVVRNIDDKDEWDSLWATLEDQLEKQIKDIFPGQQ
jgi:hypothetical protein